MTTYQVSSSGHNMHIIGTDVSPIRYQSCATSSSVSSGTQIVSLSNCRASALDIWSCALMTIFCSQGQVASCVFRELIWWGWNTAQLQLTKYLMGWFVLSPSFLLTRVVRHPQSTTEDPMAGNIGVLLICHKLGVCIIYTHTLYICFFQVFLCNLQWCGNQAPRQISQGGYSDLKGEPLQTCIQVHAEWKLLNR